MTRLFLSQILNDVLHFVLNIFSDLIYFLYANLNINIIKSNYVTNMFIGSFKQKT
jgi:hypothetical protein